MNYAQQIKHPLWQKKRLEVLELHSYECQECGATEEELHVHHPYYRRGAMIWDYLKTELKCLCHKCHKDTHALDEKIRQELSALDDEGKWYTLGFLEAKNMGRRLREMLVMDEDQLFFKAENHNHAFGASVFFGIPPQPVIYHERPQGISYADLMELRRQYRVRAGLPALPKTRGE